MDGPCANVLEAGVELDDGLDPAAVGAAVTEQTLAERLLSGPRAPA